MIVIIRGAIALLECMLLVVLLMVGLVVYDVVWAAQKYQANTSGNRRRIWPLYFYWYLLVFSWSLLQGVTVAKFFAKYQAKIPVKIPAEL